MMAGEYRLSWLLALVDQDRVARRKICQLERDFDDLLDEHGTTLRDEPGIGLIAAATLLAEVGDPFRFATQSKFAHWSAPARSSCPPAKTQERGSGIGSISWEPRDQRLLYIASVTQNRDIDEACTDIDRKLREGKTRPEARRAHKRHLEHPYHPLRRPHHRSRPTLTITPETQKN